ncbi:MULTISPECIES: SsgA family sporulation/cell division regulator [unclassified Streptomyces]|uniref:SsgA family sporulation/cell division regulator n=1 Tax=unclassified Streptomyces TaxID=2593676 RepID=UPI0036E62796
MGRDLLADGLRGSADCGDVRVRSAVGRGDQAMYIVLGHPRAPLRSRFPCRTSRPYWRPRGR